jgi:titin
MRANWSTHPGATGYTVYRVDAGTPTLLALVPGSNASYTYLNLSSLTQYTLRVRALDGNGVEDGNTNDVSATTLDSGIPPTPSAFTKGAVTPTSVAFSWTDNSANETRFEVEGCAGSTCTNYAVLNAALAAGTTAYTHAGVTANTVYRYRVRAANAIGASPWLEGTIASGFTGVSTIDPVTATTARINWPANPGAIGYLVYDVTGGGLTQLAVLAGTATSHTVSGLVPATAYTYRVRMIDAQGN